MKRKLINSLVAILMLVTIGTAEILPASAASGGPDAFGYRYLDSNEPGGPSYNFQDISGTGTLIPLGDDQSSGAIAMGFTFSYYGIDYTNVYIDSNGTIRFSAQASDWTADSFPNTGTPNNMIGGWWEDINPDLGGTIHYQTLGGTPNRYFIVQFTNIQHYEGGNPVTFQIKLFESSNNIEVHYQAAPSDGGNHSAGIENGDGSTGLSYYFGTLSLTTPLAVRYTLDITAPSLTSFTLSNPATSPTNADTLVFLATFSEAVTDVDTADFTVNSTSTATITNVTQITTSTYEVTISGGDLAGFNGTVNLNLSATPTITDLAGNSLPAGEPAADETYTVNNIAPIVASTSLNTSYIGTGPGNFIVIFNKDVDDPIGNTGTDDVTNPANYLLVNKGTNGATDTISCAVGVAPDDTQVTVVSVNYNAATYKSTVNLASALPVGSYRLFVCGTTSIVDLAGTPLNGGADYTFDFVVQPAPQPSARATSTTLPATGFSMNQVTRLPSQPAKLAYSSTDLWLEIPKLGIKTTIVGVPSTSQGWDVTWLGKNAGWLDGSAFPTWNGNSVITAHVWDALNRPGPFANLKNLKFGDQIKIHAFGQVYIYEIRESTTISPTNVSAMLKHEEKSWITLVTCEDYKEQTKTYSSRRIVRAVLVKVTTE